MKEQVGTEGITVDRINKMRNGSVELKIKGKEAKNRQIFRRVLTEKLDKVAEVNIKQKSQTVMILDIDETVTETDVKEALNREINDDERSMEDVRIKLSEKANARGLKYAFVTMAPDIATNISSKRSIGVGWNRWRLREVDNVVRCYKCQRVGHAANKFEIKEKDSLCHKFSTPIYNSQIMDIMKSYYNHYQPSLADNHQFSIPSRDFEAAFFPQFAPYKTATFVTKEDKEMKSPEIYDVNTYDSFISTTSDLTDLSSLSESEKSTYGNFNFFTLKRSQFNGEVEGKNTLLSNQDTKNSRGKCDWRE
ncbi:unnamed protein product [Phaedon cochleariae]|uniref:CCHC-type domain-containing protein n=1 Tax=Phaedon cochleariae TaxID=80249 RepID=A0A9N9SDH7_PHACE|nr:unnamed protein product [Phaedon cochleariae]